MKFSLTLPRFYDQSDPVPLRHSYEYAQLVESLGYHTGYVGHHSFTPETGDPSAPFTFLAAIAARTEKIRLGTSIYLGALHHPISICEQASTLDQVSGGRCVLGLAVGYRLYEFEGFGLAYEQRGSRLDEIIEVLRNAWGTGRYQHSGKHFSIPDLPVFPLAVQKPRPPILIGGTSRAAIRRAARLGDGWLTLPMETMSVVAELADYYRSECALAGTKPYICLMREAWVAPTKKLVEDNWLEHALKFHRYYWEAGTKGDENDPVLQRVAAGEKVSQEELALDRCIAGTPGFCIEQINRWHDTVGFDELELMFLGGGDSREQGLLEDTVRLFANEVISEASRN